MVDWSHGSSYPLKTLTESCIRSIDQSLLGTELLEGSRVVVETWEGGDVVIEEVMTGVPA